MKNILIGTSGYDYPEWKGIFYPSDLPRKDFLTFYSTKLNALELNNTFYNMPTKQRIISYIERSEEKLKFSIKAPKNFTHIINSTWKSSTIEFKEALSPMAGKNLLSSIVFQFPKTFDYSTENRIYLSELLKEFSPYPCVIEFRNNSWSKPSVFHGLSQKNASIAFPDMPPLIESNGNKFSSFIGPQAYGRLHCRQNNNWYSDSTENRYWYSQTELQKFLPIIKIAEKENKHCQIYFSNDSNGFGVQNALELLKLISSS